MAGTIVQESTIVDSPNKYLFQRLNRHGKNP
jgi:uncharacterized membrane protein